MEILPSQPKISIKKIFKDNWPNCLATHQDSIPDYVITTIEKMLSCKRREKNLAIIGMLVPIILINM